MNNDDSLMETLQDPLLTLVALILFGTLWIIVPGTKAPVGETNPKVLHDEMDELERLISDIEYKIMGVDHEIDQEIHTQLSKEEIQSGEKNKKLQVLDYLNERINRLEGKIKEKNKGNLQQGKGKELAETTRKIVQEKERIGKLANQKKTLKNQKQKKGISPYTSDSTKGKKGLQFELVGDQLYVANESNYEAQIVYYEREGSKYQRYVAVRKKGAQGESINEIKKQNSVYQKVLNKINPNSHYLYFLVRPDSYDLFLRARMIAEQKKIRVGWVPVDGPLYIANRLKRAVR